MIQYTKKIRTLRGRSSWEKGVTMSIHDLKPAKKFGFGLMRLPVLEDQSIDLPQLCKMVDAFLENGFTYFDGRLRYTF